MSAPPPPPSAASSSSAPPLSLRFADRFEMGQWTERFRYFLTICAPGGMLLTEARVASAKAAVAAANATRSPSACSEEDLYVVTATGGGLASEEPPLPWYARPGAWATVGTGPVLALTLCAQRIPGNAVLPMAAHFTNQSHVAFMTYTTRPPGSTLTMEQTALGYTGALVSALSIVLGWRALTRRSALLQRHSRFAPLPAAIGANCANLFLMRSTELSEGIPVLGPDGQVVGKSTVAAERALAMTAATRCVLPLGNFFLGPILIEPLLTALLAAALGSATRAAAAVKSVPGQSFVVFGAFTVGLPLSMSCFAEYQTIDADDLEPGLRAKVPPGMELTYHRGL